MKTNAHYGRPSQESERLQHLEHVYVAGRAWRPCIEALKDAMRHHGKPEIINTDQGSQFTSIDFIKMLKDVGIQISMDGKGAWRDECLR